jgi:hypothetical protein
VGSSLYNPSGRLATGGVHSAPLMGVANTYQASVAASRLRAETDGPKQGKPRRRSDLDSDDEGGAAFQSGPHSTSSLSMPMLTQDLSTTMTLSSGELSGPLPSPVMERRMPTEPFYGGSSSAAFTHESEASKAEHAGVREFKVRKIMTRDDSSSHGGSSSSEISGQGSSQRADQWTYSRHMAK